METSNLLGHSTSQVFIRGRQIRNFKFKSLCALNIRASSDSSINGDNNNHNNTATCIPTHRQHTKKYIKQTQQPSTTQSQTQADQTSNKKTSRRAMSEPPIKPRTVICIGDIHGYIQKLQNLWQNLEATTPKQDFQTALVIFLGDYCDRGPDTRKVIDFLIALPSKYPSQTHVFLSGNHDFAFAAFLGLVPKPGDGTEFKEGWKEYSGNEEREGWFKEEGWYEDMHLQGRRWSGKITVRFNAAKGIEYKGSIYDAGPTFESYGVPHGSPDLIKAVPDEHKKFLADLVWVHEEDDVCIETSEGIKHCKLIAVHAGLEKGKDVNEQLKDLKAKETKVPKVEALSGRKNVWDIPQELAEKEKPTIVVSGHHGKLCIEGLRLVIDQGGGYEDKPIAAIVLPSQRLVRDTDAILK